MRKLRWSALFIVPCLSTQLWAAIPAELRKVMDTLPGKKLTVDLVVSRAIQSSDAFKSVVATKIAADVPRLQALSPLEWKVLANGTITRDRREPLSPIMPNRFESNSGTLGVAGYFETGTGLDFSLNHGKTEMGFPTFGNIAGYETRATLNLSQNLWQDAFGSGTRKGKEAGRLMSEAGELAFQQNVEDFVLFILQAYYGAWLSQAQLEAAKDGAQRKARLLDITQIKARRGTAETPDVLQVRSALLKSHVQRDQAAQALDDRWRELMVALKLPQRWSTIDPAEIPIGLDSPMEEAVAVCGPQDKMKPTLETSLALRRAKLVSEAAQLSLERAKIDARPDLELRGSLSSNGVDVNSIGSTFSETSKLTHPAWTVGIQLSFPIGFYAEKSRGLTAAADMIRAEAQASQAADSLKTNWAHFCTDFHRATRARESLKAAADNQKKRAGLEEERFRIGRSSVLQVIQAGDDATFAELDLNTSEAEVRLAAWRVRRLAEKIVPYLKELEKNPPQIGEVQP